MELYSGKIAFFYDLFFEHIKEDEYFYEYFIKLNDGPALEIGSGTGRLLIPYLRSGLRVSGVEPSAQMIEICNQKAEKINLHPTVYQQFLQDLDIQEQYKTIYMPLFVFQNIIKREDAIKALNKVYKYLLPEGQVLISTYFPWNDPTGTYDQTWRINAIREIEGSTTVLSESISFDKFEQIQTKYFKFESFKNNKLEESFIVPAHLRFYSRFELEGMLESAGFKDIQVYGDYTFYEASSNSNALIFTAKKA
ncbi:MAG: methyltransferase domain-containing protein [Candidatus Babeliales bacterium]|nr:methyltransferase domain-containing protein [Candidatus Babeliales bacterium]